MYFRMEKEKGFGTGRLKRCRMVLLSLSIWLTTSWAAVSPISFPAF